MQKHGNPVQNEALIASPERAKNDFLEKKTRTTKTKIRED